MANENIKSAAFSDSIALMEKCLETMLAEQRKTAHNAIDMDDWNKAEEILTKTKTNIKNIESLKTKFAEFKAEAVNLGFFSGNKPADKPAAEAPKAEPKPAPKPEPKSMPVPETKSEPKPMTKPEPKTELAEHRNSEANPNILDMEMSDFDTEPDKSDPIVEACESLITKFPFSMRLIYSNGKIGKFFTSDDVIAENDMNKPKQLSNGLWVETGIPEEKVQSFIRSITRYCEESVNM